MVEERELDFGRANSVGKDRRTETKKDRKEERGHET